MLYRFYKLQYANLVYIGKTYQTLKERFRKHKKDKDCNSKYLFYFAFDSNEIQMTLIKEIECDKKQSTKYEGKLIRKYKDKEDLICVNEKIPGRSIKEYKIYYDLVNKEKNINYRLKNKIKLKEYNKEYYEKNKDKIKETKREYDRLYYQKKKLRLID